MASAYYASSVLFAASDLGVFGSLAKHGQADAQTLSRDCGMHPRGAQLLLDACVAVGLLSKDGALYANSPDAAAFLVPGSPADLSGAIRYNRDVYPAWGRLSAMARTGEPVERAEVHLGENPERTRTFVMAMHGRALGVGRVIVPMLDLTGCRRLFDVGGGPGTYSVLIAKAWPAIQCTVLDLPPVAAIARELVEGQGMADRVSVTGGDYHTAAFPPGNDAVMFFGMLHQESPDSIRDLLRRAHASLNPGGMVFVLDMMTDASHTQPAFSALFAVNMALTTPNGWVFSDAELKTWMSEAGFVEFECRPAPPPMPHWLATARKR
jgi:predicted O-methyltransferase YrrM